MCHSTSNHGKSEREQLTRQVRRMRISRARGRQVRAPHSPQMLEMQSRVRSRATCAVRGCARQVARQRRHAFAVVCTPVRGQGMGRGDRSVRAYAYARAICYWPHRRLRSGSLLQVRSQGEPLAVFDLRFSWMRSPAVWRIRWQRTWSPALRGDPSSC